MSVDRYIMAWKLVFAFIALSTVKCEDLIKGEDGGNLIFTDVVHARPFYDEDDIEHVFFEIEDDGEIISKILVIDLHPSKPGEVEILEGGLNQKDVLLELRRSIFYVEIYIKSDHTGEDPKSDLPSTESPKIDIPAVFNTSDDTAPVTNAPATNDSPLTSDTQDTSNDPSGTDPSQSSSDPSQSSSDRSQSSSDPSQSSTDPSQSTSDPSQSSSDPSQPSSDPSQSSSDPSQSSSDPSQSSSDQSQTSSEGPEASISDGSTATPFVNSAERTTALVGLVIPIDATNINIRND